MPKIEVAEQPGVGLDGKPRPTEDRVALLDNAVLVLDGATSPDPTRALGGWYAGQLAERLADALRASPDGDLADLLGGAISAVVREHGLRPRDSPSSTVAMLRWTEDRIDGLVLADSPIVAFGHSGYEVLADGRLASLRRQRKLINEKDVYARRNTEGGFWVAEADPGAARHAMRRSWPAGTLESVFLATDGVSDGVDDYRIFDWPGALEIARTRGVFAVLEAVRAAENADPHGERWPRSKRHDDQALVMVDFR
ncbi:protein phosphatase 2C domain-containing protein [Amycolatopsis pigmentata]|uniref:Protein phosphatase 2C domain-containing protein n=1 Tax=Amycolatopsis pigmentata TaxID=450801 RepID=A0ABW5FTJ2_9PSEU